MKTFPFILYLLLTTILLSNCGEQKITCDPDSHKYILVKPEEKAVLPYKGFDTLKLKHSSGEEYTFYAGKMDSVFYINAKSTSPDCANNIFEHKQYYKLDFTSSNISSPSLSILVGLTGPLNFSMLNINLKNNLFEGNATFPKYPNPNYIDSVNIQGKTYNKVLKLYQNLKIGSDNYVLYNAEFGVLKFVLQTGETWERVHQ